MLTYGFSKEVSISIPAGAPTGTPTTPYFKIAGANHLICELSSIDADSNLTTFLPFLSLDGVTPIANTRKEIATNLISTFPAAGAITEVILGASFLTPSIVIVGPASGIMHVDMCPYMAFELKAGIAQPNTLFKITPVYLWANA